MSTGSSTAAPRVSVLISAWRAETTVARCLAALREQTFRDFEVFLSDSSPGEETARIAAKFPEVRLLRSTKRLYSHEARNRAAAASSGELLVSLDADGRTSRLARRRVVRVCQVAAAPVEVGR